MFKACPFPAFSHRKDNRKQQKLPTGSPGPAALLALPSLAQQHCGCHVHAHCEQRDGPPGLGSGPGPAFWAGGAGPCGAWLLLEEVGSCASTCPGHVPTLTMPGVHMAFFSLLSSFI